MDGKLVASVRNRAILCILALAWATLASAQNIAPADRLSRTAEPTVLRDADVDAVLAVLWPRSSDECSPESVRVQRKLISHVENFIDGYPYRPFFHTHGISGHETYFNHPDELFFALSISLPQLPDETAGRVRDLLQAELEEYPPYGVEGFDPAAGQVRESYTVPTELRPQQPTKADSLYGVYAFWAYSYFANDQKAARMHWPAIQKRVQPLLDDDLALDSHQQQRGRHASRKLNGDAAGLIGFVRLAEMVGDERAEQSGRETLRRVLERRVNLDRVNPDVFEPAGVLHLARLARYLDLTPEVAAALREHTDGLAAARLELIRRRRPAWWLAFGPRLIGGENYTSPPDMSRAMFACSAMIDCLPADTLLDWTDVPWCQGDLYFIEKCAIALCADQRQ